MMETAIMRLILASASPRRRKLLGETGHSFEAVTPRIEEKTIDGESPVDHVLRVSREKAESVAVDFPDDCVLGADTIVVLDKMVFGKPRSDDDAARMLMALSGRTHVVYTGLTLVHLAGGTSLSRFDSTRVTFNTLNDFEIEQYIKSGQPLDKAGAYGIQDMGSFMVKDYDGELDTVIGFPRRLFESMFREVAA